jgi:hypothetical protein
MLMDVGQGEHAYVIARRLDSDLWTQSTDPERFFMSPRDDKLFVRLRERQRGLKV